MTAQTTVLLDVRDIASAHDIAREYRLPLLQKSINGKLLELVMITDLRLTAQAVPHVHFEVQLDGVRRNPTPLHSQRAAVTAFNKICAYLED